MTTNALSALVNLPLNTRGSQSQVIAVALSLILVACGGGGGGGGGAAPTPPTPTLSAPALTTITEAASFVEDVATTTATAITFTNTGGNVATNGCAASDNLPAGLAVAVATAAGKQTCQITGTPTTAAAEVTVTITATNATGNDTATVKITITEATTPPPVTGAAPSLANATAVTTGLNQAITAITFANTGDDVATNGCTASDNLPADLTVAVVDDAGKQTCQITGTPSATTDGTITVTVTATNATGSDTATVDITVNPPVPALTNIAESLTYYASQTGRRITFANTGGGELYALDASTAGCAIAPALPSGLSLALSTDRTTCEITGTPDTATAEQAYTITATNGGGTAAPAATVTLTVLAAPTTAPILANIAEEQTYNVATAITAITYTNTGGQPLSCAAQTGSELPAGLSYSISADGTTCQLTGTPEATTALATYTLVASAADPADNVTATIAFAVLAQKPNLVIDGLPRAGNLIYTATQAITDIVLVNTGGGSLSAIDATPPGCMVDSTLPSGLSLAVSTDSTTCIITGTPDTATARASYTITATNAGGTDPDPVVLYITINSPPVPASNFGIVDNDGNLVAPNEIAVLTATTGTDFSSATVLTTAGTDATSRLTYTITTATTPATGEIDITLKPVTDIAPAGLFSTRFVPLASLTPAPSALVPVSVNGGTVYIEDMRRYIGGQIVFDLKAEAGYGDYKMKMRIDHHIPAAGETPADESCDCVIELDTTGTTNGEWMTFTTPIASLTGHSEEALSLRHVRTGIVIYPDFDEQIATGAPALDFSLRMVRWEGAAGGPPPVISTPESPSTIAVGSTVNINLPATDGRPDSCTVMPELPGGLMVDISNDGSACVITGTPTDSTTEDVYTITATNDNGSTTADVTITVVTLTAPELPEEGIDATAIDGDSTTITVTSTGGGQATSCDFVDSSSGTPTTTKTLEGLTVQVSPDGNSCVITGTPTGTGDKTITVRITNDIGSDDTDITLTVNPAAPTLDPAVPEQNGKTENAITPLTITNSGGPADTCAFVVSSPSPATLVNSLRGISITVSATGDACEITGTPTVPGKQTFTVRATNVTATDDIDFDFLVIPAEFAQLELDPAEFDAKLGEQILSTIVIENTSTDSRADLSVGDCVLVDGSDNVLTETSNTYQFNGLILSTREPMDEVTDACEINGTPDTAGINVLRVRADTDDGSSNVLMLTFTVRQDDTLSFANDPVTKVVSDAPFTQAVTASSGETTYAWESSDTTVATVDPISGEVTVTTDATNTGTTTITATRPETDFYVRTSASYELTVNPTQPNLAAATQTFIMGTLGTQNLSNTGGGELLADSDSPTPGCVLTNGTLPNGLTLTRSTDENTCTIQGTPLATTAGAAVMVTITATNITGSDAAIVSITVNPALPALAALTQSYASGASVMVSLTNTGGGELFATPANPTPGCSSDPALPQGLMLSTSADASTCVISGTPAAAAATPEPISYTITATNITGASTATVNIKIIVGAPSFAVPEALRYVVGVTVNETFANTNTNGTAVTACTATDDLPPGLAITHITGAGLGGCTLSGNPTTVADADNFVITAANTNGNGTLTLNITIEPTAPMLETPAAQTYTSGATITALTLGNAITAGQLNDSEGCAITGTPTELPNGLTLSRSADTDTCVISGTPATEQPATDYVITATNVTGSNSTTVSIEILNGAPEFATPTPATINFGDVPTQSYANTNTNAFSTAVTACVADALPAGLTIAPIADPGGDENFRGGCALGGSPTAVPAVPTATNYDITATNANGSSTLTLSITINPSSPMLKAPSAQIYISGEEITPLTLSNPSTAGQLNDLNGCTVNPTLPANLTLARSDNTHTCVISGTPTEAQDAINYVITATNTSGSNTATVSIEIRNGSPDFADPDPVTIAVGDTLTQAYVNINPDGAAVTACAANSNLPQGLTIAAITGTGDDFRGGCTLSGSPIGVVAVADYDITVTNANGSFTLTLNITANPSDPMLTVPGSATRTYISGDAIDALTLINPVTAGHLNAIDGCTSDPNLTTATGLTLARSIDTHTCEISGTPTTVSDATDYVITATNANGSDTATVNITINPALPNLSAQTVRFVANEVGTHTLTNTGGGELLADDAPTPGCATTPELPNGLELNINTAASTCVISGTPTGVQAATSYDITATNRTGPGTAATVTIEILDGRPTFAADATTIVVGSQATQSYANTNPVGGPVTSCVATDALPTSLTIAAIVNTGNPEGFRGGCVLAGTPPTITAATDYNIMVTNTNGSTTLSLNIAIAPTAPMLETPAGQVYTSGAIIEPLELVNPASAGRLNTNGCTATDPLTNMPTELPTGLTLERSVDTNTCVISGTPADTQSATNYVITATNATGSDSVTVSIEILNGSPTFAAPASVTIAVDITPTQSYANTNTNAFSTAVTACVADALPAGLTIAPIADPGNVDNFRGGCALGGSPTTATAMNTYSITATNANGSSTLMLNITVDRGENMLGFNGVVNDALEWTFGGDDPATFVQAATASRDDGGTIVYASDNTLVATVGSAGEVTVLRPGVAVISATLAQTANYNAAAPASYTLTVRMAPPRISVSAFRTLSLSWPRIEAAAYYMVDHSPAAPDPGDERVFASVMVEGAEAPITNDNAAIVGDENRLSRNILIRAHQANWGGAQYQISACFDPSNTPADTSDDTCIDSQPADLAVSSSSEAVLFVKAPFPDTNILSGTESGLDVVSKALINELSDARVDVFGATVGDRFGYATALSSDGLTLAIGTPGDDGSGTGVSTTIPTAISGSADSGAVYVYTRTSTTTAWAIQAYIKTPVASTSDQFGFALALGGDDTGNTLAIGAPLEDSAAIGTSGVVASASTTTSVAAPTTIDNDAANAGAVYVYARSSEGVWALQALLKASNAEAGDMFGAALAIDTNTLAVGAPLEDSSGSDATNNGAENAGAAYVYKRTSNAWTFEQYVKASNADADNRFGSALALATDTLAVGTPGEDYLPTSGTETGIYTDTSGLNSDANNAGAVYVFARATSTWTEQIYLTVPAEPFGMELARGTRGNNFGTAVDLSANGNTLVVGVPGKADRDRLQLTGAAYIFRRSGETWTHVAADLLIPTNALHLDRFGSSVALSTDGSTLTVGASSDDDQRADVNPSAESAATTPHLIDYNAGSAYVFAYDGTNWSAPDYLKASNPDRDDGFGSSLAMNGTGDVLIVGVAGEDGNNASTSTPDGSNNLAYGAGAVYQFNFNGSPGMNEEPWSQAAYLKTTITNSSVVIPRPTPADRFGTAVAVSADGNVMAIGAPGESSGFQGVDNDNELANQNNNTAAGSGAVFVFAANEDGSWAQSAFIKASDADIGDFFGSSVSLSANGTILAAGAPGWDDAVTLAVNRANRDDTLGSRENVGRVYLFSLDNSGWTESEPVDAVLRTDGDIAVFTGLTNGIANRDFRFGQDVALSNDGATLAVLTASNASLGTSVGSDTLYVFGRTAGRYIDRESGTASDDAPDVAADARDWRWQFGVRRSSATALPRSMSLSGNGNVLAYGLPNQAGLSGPSEGAVMIYNRNEADSTWSLLIQVSIPNSTGSLDEFGAAVSFNDDGTILAIGAPGDDSNAITINGAREPSPTDRAPATGAAYIYTLENSVWAESVYIKSTNTRQNSRSRLGAAVSLSGDGRTLALGAPDEEWRVNGINNYADFNNAESGAPGAVYAFVQNEDASWSQQSYITSSSRYFEDEIFGSAVALSRNGDTLVIGAPGDRGNYPGIMTRTHLRVLSANDNRARDSGAVYLH